MSETTPQQATDYRIAMAALLRDLSREMMSIGIDMEYHGGFDRDIALHGRELFSAGHVAEGWSAEITASSDPDGEDR